MVFVKMAENVGTAPPELVRAMGEAMGQAFASGSMIDAGGLYPLAQSTEITLRGGALTVIDGPYSEAKEVAGGYSIIEARSHQEAVEGARRMMQLHQQFWPGWEGTAEIRRIADPDEAPTRP